MDADIPTNEVNNESALLPPGVIEQLEKTDNVNEHILILLIHFQETHKEILQAAHAVVIFLQQQRVYINVSQVLEMVQVEPETTPAHIQAAATFFASSEPAAEEQKTTPQSERFGKSVTVINDSQQRVGRNDPCSCGSGKKYKKCCGGAK